MTIGAPAAASGAAARYRPIGDYGFLGDCHTGARVSSDGSVDWLCLPRLDDGSYFDRLLDRDRGGWCAITPTDRRCAPADATWTARWCWRPR
jgi:GH15 family glucan-1,4-alpha-glucosidase